MRNIIKQTVAEYAEKSGNYLLQTLMKKLQDGGPAPTRPSPYLQTARPKLSDQERDFQSILNVIDRFDRPIGSADLGRYRSAGLTILPGI